MEGEDDPMVYLDEHDAPLKKKMEFIAKAQPTFGQTSTNKLLTDELSHSMSICGENEPGFRIHATIKKVNSTVSNEEDNDCDIVGAT
ncbi:hypothetical protein RYX36_036341 [Vicia faba]